MPDPKLPSSPRSDREPPSTATRIAAIGVVGVAAVIVVGMFVWMVPPAAAREAKAACGGLRPTMTNPALGQLPTVAPDFTVTGHDGKQVKLSDFRGKVVLLNFWASWCGVCKSEKPSLEEMTRHMAGDQFAVVTLASDKEWKPVQEALPNGSPFQVFLDPPAGDDNLGQIATAWGIKAVPESFIVDRTGRIRHYFVNKRDWDSGVAETCLQSLIDE
jgi:peroxiredoxin